MISDEALGSNAPVFGPRTGDIPDEVAHLVDPGWSVLYDGFRCRKCGKWSYKTNSGEWKHGGSK